MTEGKPKISTRHFLRVPGRGDDGAGAKLLLDGETMSVAELVSRLVVSDAATRGRALAIVGRITSPNSNDIHTISNALHSLAADSVCAETILYENALSEFLRAHANHPEAISIGAQLLRIRDNRNQPDDAALVCALREALEAFPAITTLSPKQESIEIRYVLLRAFEARQLTSVAVRHISAFLQDQTPTLSLERKAFANQLLPLLRAEPTNGDSWLELKRLATCVFTTGYASSAQRATPPAPPPVTCSSSGSERAPTTSGLSPTAAGLIQKLLADERQEFVPRLMPQDFQVLRQVTGLTLEVFRLVTERIRRRAASDPWARVAILDLVRSPHEPDVTARVRTAVLGALVNDARRVGKLSMQLEKEVFAISAEIPELPFLRRDYTEGDDASDTSIIDMS
jgi:hypothetical protein